MRCMTRWKITPGYVDRPWLLRGQLKRMAACKLPHPFENWNLVDTRFLRLRSPCWMKREWKGTKLTNFRSHPKRRRRIIKWVSLVEWRCWQAVPEVPAVIGTRSIAWATLRSLCCREYSSTPLFTLHESGLGGERWSLHKLSEPHTGPARRSCNRQPSTNYIVL